MDSVLDSSCRGTHQVSCALQPMTAMAAGLLLSKFVFGDPKHSLTLSKLIFGAAVWRGTTKTGNHSIARDSDRWALVTAPQQLCGDQAKGNNNNNNKTPNTQHAKMRGCRCWRGRGRGTQLLSSLCSSVLPDSFSLFLLSVRCFCKKEML